MIPAPKVVVRRGDAVDEYPLPLPFVPTYREMNLIKRVTKLSIIEILAGAGVDPDADYAVAVYAIKRENPAFDEAAADGLFDLPMGAIEIHFEAEEDEEGPPAVGGETPPPASDSSDSEPSSSGSSTTASPAESGTR